MKVDRKSILIVSFLAGAALCSHAYAYAEDQDPDLRPGFPVKLIYGDAGVWLANQQSNLAVGDIDGDGQQEIVFPTLSWNYVYALKPDGTIAPGWPVTTGVTPFLALGHLLGDPGKLDVFVDSFDESFYGVIGGDGVLQPGWPFGIGTDETFTGPMLMDVDGDGHDEIYFNRHDTTVHEFNYLGVELTPSFVIPPLEYAPFNCAQTLSTPLAINQGGVIQFAVEGEEVDPDGSCLASYTSSGATAFGTFVNGSGLGTVSPVSARLTRSGQPRIITAVNYLAARVDIFDTAGNLVSNFLTGASVLFSSPGRPDGSQGGAVQPILADLDGDGIPEIILQGASAVYVYRADGTLFPGWPATFGPYLDPSMDLYIMDDYSPQPAVGDIDGDGQPDVVVTYAGHVSAYDRFGRAIPGFPKNLNSNPRRHDNCLEQSSPTASTDFLILNPAIADIDGDGFNELIIGGSRDVCVNTPASGPISLFVYDLGGLPGGRIEWGQFRANPERTGVYAGAPNAKPDVDIGYVLNFAQPTMYTGFPNKATITITNHSSNAANNVTLDLTLPNGDDASLVTISGSGFHCVVPHGRHICRIASLGPRASRQLNMTIVSADPVATVANVQVSHDGYESKLSDNYGTIALNVVRVWAVANGGSISTTEGAAVTGTLPGKISNYSGPVTFAITSQPFHGTAKVTNSSTGEFVYTPRDGTWGGDQFAYSVSAPHVSPATATIHVSVEPKQTGGGLTDILEIVALLVGLGFRKYRTDTHRFGLA